MENTECCIPGHEHQKNIIFTHRHWASLLKTIVITFFFLLLPVIILIVAAILKPTFFHGNATNLIVIAVSLYYMIMTTFAFTEWISFYYNIFAVTDTEVIEIIQNGIFDRKISEISILRIQDVSAEVNGFWPTLFGYGDVVVESAGENTQKYVIKDIPHPVEISGEILKLHNAQVAREERGNEIASGEGDLRKESLPPFKQSEASSEPPIQPKYIEPANQDDNKSNNDSNNDSSGDISKDDLDKGGEVKF